MIAGLTLGSLLEEIGYRGVMYRALSTRMGPIAAILLNGAFFGVCHLQHFGASPLAVVLFVVSAVLMDLVMVALWTGSWAQRVAVATAFHALLNIALALVADPMTTVWSFAVLIIGTLVAAVVAVPWGRRLGLGDLRR